MFLKHCLTEGRVIDRYNDPFLGPKTIHLCQTSIHHSFRPQYLCIHLFLSIRTYVRMSLILFSPSGSSVYLCCASLYWGLLLLPSLFFFTYILPTYLWQHLPIGRAFSSQNIPIYLESFFMCWSRLIFPSMYFSIYLSFFLFFLLFFYFSISVPWKRSRKHAR